MRISREFEEHVFFDLRENMRITSEFYELVFLVLINSTYNSDENTPENLM